MLIHKWDHIEEEWEDPKSQRLGKTKAEMCLLDEFMAAVVPTPDQHEIKLVNTGAWRGRGA